MKIIGIDTGKGGAGCEIDYLTETLYGGTKVMSFFNCPLIQVGKRRVYDLEEMNKLILGSDLVVIEKAQAMPKQGVVSMFEYGGGYYAWLMACVANKIRYHIVDPKTWKKIMLKDMSHDKGASIIRAKQILPEINLISSGARKPNHNWAEAFLLAVYGAWHVNR